MLRQRYRGAEISEKLKKVAHYESLIRTSWNYQASQFFENSTLHGVRYIAEKGRPFLEKFMWFCCVTIGAIATMIIIVSLWGKFQTNPTITGLDTDFHNWDVAFPALTLCEVNPANDTYIENFILQKWPDEPLVDKRKEFFILVSKLNYENVEEIKKFTENRDYNQADIGSDLKALTYSIVSHCEDVILECKWKDEPYNCCNAFFPIFTEHGFCYTFNSRHHEVTWPWLEEKLPKFELEYIQETDVKWAFKFSSNSPNMLVFIHNSDEVPSIDTNPQHIWDQKVNKISFSMKQTYTTDDAKQLTIRQRRCIFDDEVKLNIDKKMYTYTACTRQCRMESAKKYCGCIPIFYPEINGFTHCNLESMACIANNVKSIVKVDHCNCELGCSNTVYEVEKLNERTEMSNAPSLESEFVSWPMVRYKREVLFGWVDLLVSFGGIAGLFLGFSLLSGVEILYYFTVRACCMVYREKEEVLRIKSEHASKPKPQYDLSLQPKWRQHDEKEKLLGNKGFIGNRIEPLFIPAKQKKILRSDAFQPPFGIEFIN